MFEQLDPLVTPASEIRRAAKETAVREIDSQREQFRLLGIMADWDSKERTYRTFGMSSYLACELIVFYLLSLEHFINKIATMSFVNYGYSKKWLRKACFFVFYIHDQQFIYPLSHVNYRPDISATQTSVLFSIITVCAR